MDSCDYLIWILTLGFALGLFKSNNHRILRVYLTHIGYREKINLLPASWGVKAFWEPGIFAWRKTLVCPPNTTFPEPPPCFAFDALLVTDKRGLVRFAVPDDLSSKWSQKEPEVCFQPAGNNRTAWWEWSGTFAGSGSGCPRTDHTTHHTTKQTRSHPCMGAKLENQRTEWPKDFFSGIVTEDKTTLMLHQNERLWWTLGFPPRPCLHVEGGKPLDSRVPVTSDGWPISGKFDTSNVQACLSEMLWTRNWVTELNSCCLLSVMTESFWWRYFLQGKWNKCKQVAGTCL